MGNSKKKSKQKWKLRWNAPDRPTVAIPHEIVIEQAPDSAPTKVVIEVWESDAQKYDVDDYLSDAKTHEKGNAPDSDLLAIIVGELKEHPSRPKGRLFVRGEIESQFISSQGNDHVGLLFEGEAPEQAFWVTVPPSGFEVVEGTGDGSFYELFFIIKDAAFPEGEALATSKMHVVRQRTDLLLAVEPLSQAGSGTGSQSGMTDMILSHFHDGSKATKNRNWGSVIVAMRNGQPMVVTESGCSIATLTMIMRYLQVKISGGDEAPAEASWQTLYDRTAGGHLDQQFRPRVPYKKPDTVGGQWKAVSVLTTSNCLSKIGFDTKSISNGELEQLAASIRESDPSLDPKAVKRKKTPRALDPESWSDTPPDTHNAAFDDYFRPAKEIAHHWVTRVIWWLRQESGAVTDKVHLQRGQMRWQKKLEGGDSKIVAMVDDQGNPVWKYRFTPEPSPEFCKEAWKPVPLTSALTQRLGLKVKVISLSSTASWEEELRCHLDRGLPAIAHFKSGAYQHKDGGHYTLAVGYRLVGGKPRFIINDPGGAKRLQYETLREEDVEPTTASKCDAVETLKIEILEKGKNKSVLASASWGKGNLSAKKTLEGLTAGGVSISLEVSYVCAYSNSKFSDRVGGVRIAIQDAGVAIQVVDVDVKRSGDKKTFIRKPTGATLEVDGAKLQVTLSGSFSEPPGERLFRAWEGKSNVLVERKNRYSLCALHLFETAAAWERGAARFVRFDGRSADGEP